MQPLRYHVQLVTMHQCSRLLAGRFLLHLSIKAAEKSNEDAVVSGTLGGRVGDYPPCRIMGYHRRIPLNSVGTPHAVQYITQNNPIHLHQHHNLPQHRLHHHQSTAQHCSLLRPPRH